MPSLPRLPLASLPLVRGLTLLAAVAVVLANVIGTGVFLKARVMMCNVGEPEMVLLVWVAAGLLSLAGALTYAELGAMMPHSGGEYNFLGAAYGRVWAFLNGWMRTFIGQTGAQAAVAVAFVIFLNDLLRGTLDPLTLRLLPVGIIAVGTALNLASVKSSGQIATALTTIKVALVLGIGVGAFVLADGALAHFSMSGAAAACADVPASARFGLAGFGAAMLGALWGYDGWNTLTHVGGEVRDPQRNIPRALIGGVALIMVLYVFVNAAYFWVLSPEAVANVPASSSVALEAAVRFLGPAAIGLMAAGLMASSFGTLHTSILAGSRITYAMAQDGLMPRALGEVTPRMRVPAASVLLHGAWASILALSGSFDTLTDYVIFGSWIFYGMTAAAVFVLRRKWPNVARPYKTWGYPVVPALFLVVTAFLLVNTVLTAPTQALAGLALIVIGLPVYWFYSRTAGPEPDWKERPDQDAPSSSTTGEM